MDRRFKICSFFITASLLYFILSVLDDHIHNEIIKNVHQTSEHKSSLNWQQKNLESPPGGASSEISEASSSSRDINNMNEKTYANLRTPNILLLSSLGRSGSSFLGELLAQQKNAFYLFEPELYLHRWTNEGVNTNNSINIIRKMFACQFESDFIHWLHSRGFNLCVKSEKIKSICKGDKFCISSPLLAKVCQSESVNIIKVIKMRLSWTTELLMDPNLNLKVIHLIRDPRASINSMSKTQMPGMDPQLSCPSLIGDLQTFPVLQKIFPNKVTSVKYEDLALYPWETAQKLWSFLAEDDKSSLPVPWSTYLQEHTKPPPKSSYYSTKRNSSAEMEAWRDEISEKILLDVENYCGHVLQHLGHTTFGSIENCRNKSLSLYVKSQQ
ncbi:unnamed protein product [Meganyctiphanes norvegica]|uniref:Sulfotransferase domain-containing protein n=1 Tax=Meganyctiphanes norvegica TaxID=48144 RepID=A0AAV2QM60_MEGNR